MRINQLLHHQKFSNHYTPLHVLTKLEKNARSNRKKNYKIIHILLSIPINTEIVSKMLTTPSAYYYSSLQKS